MNTSINLGKDKVSKVFWTYAIPSILAMIAQTTATMIDSIFIGQYVGPIGLSAITVFFPMLGLLIGIGSMFAIGGTTLAGIELGKGNQRKSNRYFNITVWLLGILSIVATTLVIYTLPLATNLFSMGETTKINVLQYGQTISYFFLFFMMNFALSFFLKLDGKPIIVVIVMVSGTLINILLDYILIVHLNLGLYGAALATGASQLIPWLILLVTVVFKSNWQFCKPNFNWKDLKQIIFNGSSELLSNSAVAISGVFINTIILARVGEVGLAGYAVALQIAGIASSLGYGFAESNQTAISYNLGANQLDRVKSFRTYTLKANLITGFLIFISTYFLGEYMARLFVKEISTIHMASQILKYYAVAFIFMGSNITLGTYYTAINDPMTSAGITFYRSLLGLGIGLILGPLFFGDTGIWLAIIFTELSTFIIGRILLAKKPYGINLKKNIKQLA